MASPDELTLFSDRISRAKTPEDLFGHLAGDQPQALKHLYRSFARVCHADLYAGDAALQATATRAFARLATLYTEAQERLKVGKYGTARATQPALLKTKGAAYRIDVGLAGGDLSTVYRGHVEGKPDQPVVVKIARHPSCNDLLERESTVLSTLYTVAASKKTRFTAFLPEVIEQAAVRLDGTPRRVTVFTGRDGFYSLPDVVSRYPEGLDPRHFVWIWRRLLSILGFAHSQNVIHGAVLPPHVLIHPETHGLMLVGWTSSVDSGHRIRTISTGYAGWYPPEVMARQNATPATDIAMAAKCMAYILGGDDAALPATVPEPFQRVLRTCWWANVARRPQDAWTLYDTFSPIAHDIYGPPKFIPLDMGAP